MYSSASQQRPSMLLKVLLHYNFGSDGTQIASKLITAACVLARTGGEKDFHDVNHTSDDTKSGRPSTRFSIHQLHRIAVGICGPKTHAVDPLLCSCSENRL